MVMMATQTEWLACQGENGKAIVITSAGRALLNCTSAIRQSLTRPDTGTW